MFSFFKKKNELKNIEIITEENSIENILNFIQSYRANFSLILLKNAFQNGSAKAKLKVNFDKLNGKYISVFYSGVKDEVGTYKNGKKEGKWNLWHKNGTRRKEIFYEAKEISNGKI